MGRLVDGEWVEAPERGHDEQGFDDWVRPPGADAPFTAESGRYHLYVSRACPWAHRTTLVRRLGGLTDAVSLDVVDPHRESEGWTFTPSKDGCTPDTRNGFDHLREVYTAADPDYTGRVTVPVLWDTERATVVNNESADVARMLATAFADVGDRDVALYPADRRDEIDEVAADVHESVNLAVYEAGFADSQAAYEDAVGRVFDALDRYEARLSDQRYLLGEDLTLADVFLFPTLYRFDAVYHTHFKCNVRRVADYPNLHGYLRDLYQLPGVAATCDVDHVKEHYYRSHGDLNPTGFVPVGPDLALDAPHDRDRLPGGPPAALT